MKKKILSCVLLFVFVIAAAVPSALAAPTNSNYWNRCFVYGGPSQQICPLSCTDTTHYEVDIDAIALNGQEHITFRPYGSEGQLSTVSLNISNVTSNERAARNYNRGNLFIGKMITMKVSIPSTSDGIYATFRGTVYI